MIAAVRQNYDAPPAWQHSVWKFSDDHHAVLEATVEDTVFATTIDELQAQLEAKFPHPSGLSRVRKQFGYCLVYNHPILPQGATLDETTAALQRVGTAIWLGDAGPFKKTCIAKRLDADDHLLTYAPERAAKRAKTAQLADESRPIKEAAIRQAGWALNRSTRYSFMYRADTPVRSKHEAVRWLMECVLFFDLVFGKNEHRRQVAWQRFIKIWKRKKDANHRWLCAERLSEIADFMQAECRARPPRNLVDDTRSTVADIPEILARLPRRKPKS